MSNPYLPDAVLVQCRGVAVAGLLLENVVRSRPAGGTDDGQGGITPGTPTTANYMGRLLPDRLPKNEMAGEAIRAVTTWKVALPYDADILPGDTLAIAGQTILVIDTDTGTSESLFLTAIGTRLV